MIPAMIEVLVPVVLEPLPEVDGVSYYEEGELDLPLEQVRFFVPMYMGTAESLEPVHRMPALEVLQLLTIGYDGALEALPEGVALCNAVGVHESSTGELAVGLIIASLRGLDEAARAMPEGRWIHQRREALADKTVLIIGAGGVGRAVAARLQGFDVTTILMGRTRRDRVLAVGELDAVLPRADIVVLAVPLTEDTRRMVDGEFLRKMRDGALLVNVSRGGIVDTGALLAEVSRGRVRAALDVTDPEPLPSDHPLWQAPGVLITPHVGGNTSTFLPRARELVSAQIGRWRSGVPLENVVGVG